MDGNAFLQTTCSLTGTARVQMRIPRGANYLFVCKSKQGKLGWLDVDP